MTHEGQASGLRIGVELSAHTLKLVGLEEEGGLAFLRQLPMRRGSYLGIVEDIAALIKSLAAEGYLIRSIGVAIPGTHVASTGLVKNANVTELNGRPLWQDLEAALGQPIRLANDANCFALAEATDGAAAGCGLVFGVILDAGCGGGLVANGRALVGANGLTGEWGHNHLPHPQASDLPELACHCGHFGCIETYLSVPAFMHDFQTRSGHSLSVREIAAAAAAGDHRAEGACLRLEDRLARGLAEVINIVDPDCIVVGGELASVERIYKNVPGLWRHYIFGGEVNTRLIPARHGEASGVRGAAWLWD